MDVLAKPKEDFLGIRFGRLTVVSRADDYIFPNGKYRSAKWHCKCDCGNEIDVKHAHLKDGNTVSCGCYRNELAKQTIHYAIEACKKPLKDNPTLETNLTDDKHSLFGKFKCNNNDTDYVYFSMSDYELIKNYCWTISWAKGNYYRVITSQNNTNIAMHRLFGMYDADHINRNPLDNRRENLNPDATRSDQNHNRNKSINNTTGIRCLGYDEKCINKPWHVQCRHNNKKIIDKHFSNKDEAIMTILKTEIEYYPECSWQKDLMIKYGLIRQEDIS